MAELKDFIVRTRLDNTDENQKTGNSAFDTQDYVFLESYGEVKDLICDERIVYPSDYAAMNGACMGSEYIGKKVDRQSTSHILRTAKNIFSVYQIKFSGTFSSYDTYDEGFSLCPVLQLNLSAVVSAQKTSQSFKIEPSYDKNGEIKYHTIEFGTYPQDKVKNSDELERLFNAHRLTPTGKTYTGYMKEDGSFEQNQEFEYGGKKYVRVISNRYDGTFVVYKDKTTGIIDGLPVWAEVQPIKWKIKNWDELPRSINPNGSGTAKTIYVKSEEAILSGIPFYPGRGKTEHTMWQNSPLRAIFNGYDLHKEIDRGNGNQRYKADINFDFKGKGFLEEAFDMSLTLFSSMENVDKEMESQQQVRKSRLEKLNPDKTPEDSRRRMTDTEMIKSWIDAGQSVLLRGPSGIGKTERIKKLYPNLIYIKLTNNMFPEKVVGSMNLQTGQSIPPDFAKHALLACATDEEKEFISKNIQNLYDLADTIYERSKSSEDKVVIMLDELLNVKPAVQSLVYTLVLNKLVETGKGLKLPANTVVVATGNQKKYSSVAEDLVEPLEKRFDHILDMEPNVGQWIYEFAIPSKIHPAVIGYILSKYTEKRQSEKVDDIGYFYEEPEVGESHLDRNGCRGRTNDPRGWESISNMLYAFEEDLKNGKFIGKDVETLLKVSLSSKLRNEWAKDFFDFYNNPTLTVEDIIKNRYTKADLPRDINEKVATMLGLLSASPEQVKYCREFIQEHCNSEYLSVYDMYWAGTDEQRIEKIAELEENSIKEIEKEEELVK